MSIELKIPDAGESIAEVQIARWLKQEGEHIERDENLVELETDKASMELPSPVKGTLREILKEDGQSVQVGEVIAYLDEGGDSEASEPSQEKRAHEKSADSRDNDQPKSQSATRPADKAGEQRSEEGTADEKEVESKARAEETEKQAQGKPRSSVAARHEQPEGHGEVAVTPSARRALRQHGLSVEQVPHSGDRLRREDVVRFVKQQAESKVDSQRPVAQQRPAQEETEEDLQQVVPMSLIRRRIAQRLVQAQQEAALLTTFNEVDMTEVMALRKKYREVFEQRYGVRLGFMSFFVKASIDALKQFPELNAEIREKTIIYRDYYHVGIAIGSDRGLVVPVIRFAERLSFAEIEQAIDEFAKRAQSNKLSPAELEGGTFTISNGGVYGSMLSTPIVNPPQSGVLGMHAIDQRPVARDGQVVIRPMMYLALTYDHRIVDGREAVSFLKRLKQAIEDPARMLVEV